MVLRHLLSHWLRSAATQKARDAVMEAAREQVRSAAEQAGAAQGETQERPLVGLVFALGIESGCLEDRLDDVTTTRGEAGVVRQGRLGEACVSLILSGAGRQAAAKATEALIAGHRPRCLISAGFAGGLHEDLSSRDLLVADCLVDTQGRRLALDLKVDRRSLAETPAVHVGRLLTADRIVRAPKEKRSLGKQHDALAVDMETLAVAEVARHRGVPLLAVRVIHDAVDDQLPADVEHLLKQKTTAGRLGAAAGAIWNRPGSFKDMVQLRENALLASERLAKFLAEMIASW